MMTLGPAQTAANAERDAKIRKLAECKIPYANIAERMGVPVSSVKRIVSAARKVGR